MTKWLRGKRGGFIAFVAITALVAGGLGWVTCAALELEDGFADISKLKAALESIPWVSGVAATSYFAGAPRVLAPSIAYRML